MSDSDDFSARIRSVFAEKSQALRTQYITREALHTELERAWSPLTDHMKMLAEKFLPVGKALKIALTVDHTLQANLEFQLHDTTRDLLPVVDMLHFENDFHRHASWYMSALDHSPYAGKAPHLGLKVMSRQKLPGSPTVIHADDIKTAKDLLETWLATQIAFDFDQDRLYPSSTLEITLKRSGSTPENTP